MVEEAGTELSYSVTFLEMRARPRWGWPPLPAGAPASLLTTKMPPAWYFLALYDAVGRDYAWEDLHALEPGEVEKWLSTDGISVHVLIRDGWPQGFFALDESAPETTEISYLGLVPQLVGRGFGKWLVKTAVLTAWEREGLECLTINTCSLDHPRALALYQSHGFNPVRREERSRTLTRSRDPSRIPD